MRKLLVILNAMLRDRTPGTPTTPPQKTSRAPRRMASLA
jgi:hypothetical protein